MRESRGLTAIVILAAVVGGLIGIVGNVASGVLPESWDPYLWISWPVFGVLLVLGIALAVWQYRSEQEQTGRAGYGPSGDMQRPFQLPPDLPMFAGRDTHLEYLDDLMQPGSC
ncbi:MAG: hypothetical protein E3J64_01940, partial [Anaerolineales bacterium]